MTRLYKKIKDQAEYMAKGNRPQSLPRQVLQVEDPVWVWTIKYWRVAAFLAWQPAFLRRL